ncbi:hypothetical protein D3C81_2027960 [compost metagenome]
MGMLKAVYDRITDSGWSFRLKSENRLNSGIKVECTGIIIPVINSPRTRERFLHLIRVMA